MSTESNHNAERDVAVSAAFREWSTEETPPGIDRRILDQAATEARTNDARGPRWTQPLAWAAMIVVTMTIVLQVADTPDVPEPRPVAPASPESAPDFGAPRSDMLEQASEFARERAGTSAERSTPAAAGATAPAALAAPAATPCDDEARATPAAWFACIEALRASGSTEAAEQELEALREAFPDFDPP